jgi:transcriptional regulator with XRE-family HTH domain
MSDNKEKDTANGFGDYLKCMRENKGLRLKDVAERSGISVSYLNRLERNERFNPSIPLLTKLVKSLDISILDLLQISLEIDKEKSIDIRDVILEGNYVMESKEVSEEVRVLLCDIIEIIGNDEWKKEKKADMLSEELIRKVKYLNQVL